MLIGLIVQASVSSQPGLSLPTYVPNTCIVDPNDPFEPNVAVESGPMKGFCVNPLVRRSAQILTDEQAARYFESKAGHLVIANFSHLGKFWVAQIPVEKAKSLILQVQMFPLRPLKFIKIGHTQFRFEFENEARIDLVEQSQVPGRAPERRQLKRMIFSVENIGPYGDAFDAMKGLKGHYNIAYRAVSLDDKYQWMIAQQNHEVRQYQIKMTPDEVSRLLLRSLEEAQRWSARRSYHTLDPNCVTELFVLLNDVLKKDLQIPQLPNFAPSVLKSEGLIERRNSYPTLNEEYGKLN